MSFMEVDWLTILHDEPVSPIQTCLVNELYFSSSTVQKNIFCFCHYIEYCQCITWLLIFRLLKIYCSFWLFRFFANTLLEQLLWPHELHLKHLPEIYLDFLLQCFNQTFCPSTQLLYYDTYQYTFPWTVLKKQPKPAHWSSWHSGGHLWWP